MTARAFDPRRPTRAALVIGGVLMLHGLVTWLLLRTPAAPARATSARLTVRFVPLAPTKPPAPPTARPAVSAAARPVGARPRFEPAPIRAVAPAGATTPSAEAAGAIAAAVGPDSPASAPPNSSALDLTVRPDFAARGQPPNPALDDPRANAARLDLAARMAATLGSDARVTEENLGDGRRRLRSGATCVIVTPSRAGQLDPFGQPAQRGSAPSLVSPCP